MKAEPRGSSWVKLLEHSLVRHSNILVQNHAVSLLKGACFPMADSAYLTLIGDGREINERSHRARCAASLTDNS